MFREIRKNSRALVYAILVHIALAVFLVISLDWKTDLKPAGEKVDIVKAVAVDEKMIQAEVDRLKKIENKKRKQETDRVKKLERKRKKEEQRIADLKKKRAVEEKKRKQETRRLTKLKKEKAALEKKNKAEQKRLHELETKRKQEEDLKRKADEQKARAVAEKALKEKLAEEERQRQAVQTQRLNTLREKYILAIQSKVRSKWLRPPGVSKMSCLVKVQQVSGGEVVNVRVSQCSGTAAFTRSVELAVYKASPLPPPPSPEVFDRDIEFTFKSESEE